MSTSPEVASSDGGASLGTRFVHGLSFRNIGAVYVLAVLVIVFSIWVPETFPTWATAKQILNGSAVTGLIALSLVIPLCCGIFDLSVAYTASLSGVVVAYLVSHGAGVPVAIAAGLGAALFVGLLNSLVVVVMRVDSFIGTLATGSLVQAFTTFVTNDIAINDPRLLGGFSDVAQQQALGGLTLPVIYTAVIASILWFLLEHTVTGRRMYATGFNHESARLGGVRIDRLRFVSLLCSSSIAGIGGVVLASTIGSGSPSAGTAYLLPAFAAAFLGATQLRGGRFNPWGTLIAVVLLGTGTTGLALAAAPQWSANMFTGVVLIASLAITGAQRRVAGAGWRRRLAGWVRRGGQPSVEPRDAS